MFIKFKSFNNKFFKKNEKWIGSGNLNKNTSDTERLYKALVLGLRDYVNNNKFPGVVLGLSDGIDSALVAAIAADALGSENVQAIMLPSPFTGQESLNDAKDVANYLKIKFSNLKIDEAMKIIDKTLGKFNGKRGITEENIQSRLRGLLLMALSNRWLYGIATGNKSEYAVGYSTLYGDMCGGFDLSKMSGKQMFSNYANGEIKIFPNYLKDLKEKLFQITLLQKHQQLN